MKYNVEITERAEAELHEAYLYIADDSPQRAKAWRERLLEATSTLEKFPKRCPLAPESELCGREIRHLILGNYRVLFEIRERTVYILRILHSARDRQENF